MPTFIKIASASVTANTASNMEFTNIPSTYSDLYVLYSIKSNVAGGYSRIEVSFNGSTTGYSEVVYYGIAGSDFGGSQSSSSVNFVWTQATQDETSGVFGNGGIYIPNYSGSTNKSIGIDFTGASTIDAGMVRGYTAGLWSNTSSVTSVKLAANTGSFVRYSTATLYGIKKN